MCTCVCVCVCGLRRCCAAICGHSNNPIRWKAEKHLKGPGLVPGAELSGCGGASKYARVDSSRAFRPYLRHPWEQPIISNRTPAHTHTPTHTQNHTHSNTLMYSSHESMAHILWVLYPCEHSEFKISFFTRHVVGLFPPLLLPHSPSRWNMHACARYAYMQSYIHYISRRFRNSFAELRTKRRLAFAFVFAWVLAWIMLPKCDIMNLFCYNINYHSFWVHFW